MGLQSMIIHAMASAIGLLVLAARGTLLFRGEEASVNATQILTTFTLRPTVEGRVGLILDRVLDFRVRVLDDSGQPTNDAASIRQIEVYLSVLIPTTQGDEQHESVGWKTTFRPVNLGRGAT